MDLSICELAQLILSAFLFLLAGLFPIDGGW